MTGALSRRVARLEAMAAPRRSWLGDHAEASLREALDGLGRPGELAARLPAVEAASGFDGMLAALGDDPRLKAEFCRIELARFGIAYFDGDEL